MNVSEYTTEELLALSSGLGLGDPLFLLRPPFADWSPDVRDEVNRIGMRSLVARDLVRVTATGQLEVPELIASLCNVCCTSELIVQFVRVQQDAVSTCCFLSTPTLTAGQRITSMGNHRMTLFPTEHAPTALAEVLAIVDRPKSAHKAVGVSLDQASAMFNATRDSQPEDTVETLIRRSGTPPETTKILTALAGASTIANAVQVMAPSAEGDGLEGSVTTWIDAGKKGLWIAETVASDDGNPPTVELLPTTKAAIAESIAEGFPAWLDVRAALGA